MPPFGLLSTVQSVAPRSGEVDTSGSPVNREKILSQEYTYVAGGWERGWRIVFLPRALDVRESTYTWRC